jgi:uncharacterized membrane protein YkvA (DUF1232 family)
MEQFKMPDDDLDDREPMSEDRAQRFYDRLRGSIQSHVHGKFGEYLLLVPDMFMLLWRLANDSRVSGKNKVLLGTGIAYYIFPFDFLPEAFVGPMGYLDDLIFAVYVLNKMLTDTDVEIVRAHWSGSEDVLDAVRRVLGMADQLVTSNVLNKLKKMF